MPGYIIYKGPSKIDGSPIIVVAIMNSTNAKTGGKNGQMIQTYILQDNGKSPMENSREGLDYSICGDCKHRGTPAPEKVSGVARGRSCYVTLHHGPLQVWKAYTRGSYPEMLTRQARLFLAVGYNVRLGTYGDPLAVPGSVWRDLLAGATGSTGYTHASGILPGSNISRVMLSADTPEQAQNAHNNGLRTFRVIPIKTWNEQGKGSLLDNEILCPASKEAGQRTTCNDCKLCSGQDIKAKSIAIPAHGIGRAYA